MGKELESCKYLGCIYNCNGTCQYDEAAIKLPHYQACNDDIVEADYEI